MPLMLMSTPGTGVPLNLRLHMGMFMLGISRELLPPQAQEP
jgi:hypothetical protein